MFLILFLLTSSLPFPSPPLQCCDVFVEVVDCGELRVVEFELNCF